MLIICNGAIKSGSTWLYNILINIVECKHPPENYLTGRSEKSPCLRPDMFEKFLREENYTRQNFITKNHLADSSFVTLFQSNPQVYVFDIERDPKDVAVSNYYHDQFRNGYEGEFDEYYWSSARYVVDQLASYHNLWRDSGPRNYVSSYERLQSNFEEEVVKIAEVLGVNLSSEQVAQLKTQTSLKSLRTEYKKDERYQGAKFFRKGEVGDWVNHFDKKMLHDASSIIDSGISKYDYRRVIRTVKNKVGLSS
jgi:hypothetical protein